jgi:two-component system chemotaxis response regulator CheY
MSARIMTVDDSVSMRLMVRLCLEEAGFDVMDAEDGVDALEKLSGSKCELVIADLNMPNMNGIELIRKLREHPDYRFTPILMLTTESGTSIKEEGRKAGATGWIVKPFKPEQLVGVVRKVLQ